MFFLTRAGHRVQTFLGSVGCAIPLVVTRRMLYGNIL